MKYDFIIRNGRVVDPSRNIDQICDVGIVGTRIVDVVPEAVSEHVIDASGCIVTPGLIDYHTHIFSEGSSFGIRPDGMIAQGTTAAVDAGTSGTVTFDAFYKTVIAQSALRIKGYVTIYSGGQLDPKLCEDFNPELYNLDKLERIVDKYRDSILGLKVRLSKGVVPDESGLDYLKKIVETADNLNSKLGTSLRVCVHTTNSPMSAGDLAECLRPGDIFCHCYQGAGSTIILEDGSIEPKVLESRKRGVIFDAANGRGNFDLAVARKALAQGFLPDIISSDLTVEKYNQPPYSKNLPVVISKYLTLGLSLMEVIRTVTENPARAMNMEGRIGTLASGSYADISIFKEKEIHFIQKDWHDVELECDRLLVPQLTMCAGEIQYCQTDFYL